MSNKTSKAKNKADKKARKKRRSYDAAAKKLLSNKRVLANILKYFTEEFKDCTIKEIISCLTSDAKVSRRSKKSKESEGSEEQVDDKIRLRLDNAGSESVSEKEGTRSFDVKFKVKLPNSDENVEIIINIEAQSKYNDGYRIEKRGTYYLSRLISSQYGVEFLGSDFNKLKKVYTIWICLNVPEAEAGTATGYRMIKGDLIGEYPDRPEDYDLQRMVIARLGRGKNDEYKEIMEMLNILFNICPQSGLSNKEEKILKEKFEIDIEEIKGEVDNMCSLSQGILEEGIEQGLREGKEAGIKEGMEKGMEKGKREGIKEGMEKGIKEGEIKAKVEMINNLQAFGMNLEEALKAAKMDKRTFLKLKEKYEPVQTR